MATHFRYSLWDGSQDVPDFSADEILERMADDLLRGGDPDRAMRNLLRRGFTLPDGRRFEGMQRLLNQMRQYRQDVFSRYDPNGVIDRVREQLNEILDMERGEIDHRRQARPDGTEGENGAQQHDSGSSSPQ